MKQTLLTGAFCAAILAGIPTVSAADKGGISPDVLREMKESYRPSPAERAIGNAAAGQNLDELARTRQSRNAADTYFSHKVESKGITNQKKSGRCWLFTGLNVLRSQMMKQHDLPELQLSQAYNFFYDQLEKSNLFLQSIIDTSSRPADDKTVDWLFHHPLSDGGQFTGLADNVSKYGVVPASAMAESYSTENTSRISQLISLKLREYGLELRKMKKQRKSLKQMERRKEEMLKDVYRMLATTMGEPVETFTWTRCDKNGKPIETKQYTPLDFYMEYAGNDLKNGYVMLMNDPSRPYYKLYEIDLDRHVYDGDNWRYINLPTEDIKKMAIESIKDSTMMYFSCDVGKFLDRDRGILDPDQFDYESLMGVKFGMDKSDRIRSYASASSHAMTLMAVDLDADGKPRKWMVENSWGKGANDGHLIMTDKWFDEYMFRLVVDKKYVPAEILKILDQKPELLPAWDPLFSEDF